MVSVDSITIFFEPDTDPDVSWLTDSGRWSNAKDEARDRKRLAAFEEGDWHMVGVIAVAELDVDGTTCGLRHARKRSDRYDFSIC